MTLLKRVMRPERTIGIGSADVVLVRVKSNEWPRSAEVDALLAFTVPPNCLRLVHRWRDRQRVPDVREV